MNSKFKMVNAIFIFVIVFIGNILTALYGIYADFIFTGVAAIVFGLIGGRIRNRDLDEKYRNMKYAEIRHRYVWFGLVVIGAVCIIFGVIMYFDNNIKWALMLLAILVLSLIPLLFIDGKYWAQVPREERPWAYRGIKSKEENMEEQ